ncbi:MAG: phosphoribosylamine--glycine ligase [Planctomycetota bacterium]|nr:phosphoribosylamine--glycine ligase [Planctomycetota bacterium]MDA1179525.1 phosphoribosylamine--glycine ligase [Planctomycetota bacterium]
MNLLVVGNGGREHALAWKLAQSPRVNKIYVAPGNAGTALDAENVDIAATDIPRLIDFARDQKIGLTVVGPEAPLSLGIVDAFEAAGLRVFGPRGQAAELEASKVFCKELLHHANIPTADHHSFRDADSATRFIRDRYATDLEDVPLVVKADGLAGGKGVIVCSTRRDALDAIDRLARQKEFGDAGKRLVIEERLEGQEASVFAITDGRTILTLPPAQDHKAAFDGDLGPNTGGMGAYSPTPLISDEMLSSIESNVLVPTVHAMKRARRPFHGILFAGIMVTNQGPKVLEFNVRFGDPECQPILMRWQGDLLDVLEAVVDRRLDEVATPTWDPRPAVCVVMASEGYPSSYKTGLPIRGLDEAAKLPDIKVFHSGTAMQDGQVVSQGGRVLSVTALGTSIAAAKLQAYKAVRCIRWEGAWCRKDIADKSFT